MKRISLPSILLLLIIAGFAQAQSDKTLPASPPVGEITTGEAQPEDAQAEHEEDPDLKGIEFYRGTVSRVVEANLIEISGQRLHLLGVSAPRRWWWKEPKECYSGEAATFLEENILGKEVLYGYDQKQRSHEGDSVRRVYVFSEDRNINKEMIAKGFGFADRARIYVKRDEFLKNETEAKLHMLGLWHRCPVECARNRVCQTRNW